MKLLDYLRYPVSPRRMGIWFMLGGVALFVMSYLAISNDRGDWLDPRWWIRGIAAYTWITGFIFVVVPNAWWYRR